MDLRVKKSLNARLKLVEGQIRGVSRMIYHNRYCTDVLTQTSAVCAALRRIEQEIIRDHLSSSVVTTLKRGSSRKKKEKINEMIAVLAKMTK